MALSDSRLDTALRGTYLTRLQAEFPIPVGLLDAERSTCDGFQQKLAHAMADGGAAPIISEFTAHAEVPAGIAVATTGSPGVHTGATTTAGQLT